MRLPAVKIVSIQQARRFKLDHVPLGDGRAAVANSAVLPPWYSPRSWTGAGDALAAVFKAVGIGAAAKAVERVTGKPCGCGGRQARLNEKLMFHVEQ